MGMVEMDKNKLKISIDLGAATVKCAYAYVGDDGNFFGKLHSQEDTFSDKGYPSLAFYDEDTEQWQFGEKVFEGKTNSFKTVVKIKDLMTLLIPKKVGKIEHDESKYYFNEHEFPIFYFPERLNSSKKTYREAIAAKMTFTAKQTPQQVCEMFFETLQNEYLQPELRRVAFEFDLNNRASIVAVYPTIAGTSYIEELTRLINCTFDIVPDCISAPKAVGLYAFASGYLPKNCNAIVVNVGECDISVAKIQAEKGYIRIDGADAHNNPEELGGNAYDEALGAIVEAKVAEREVLGMRKDGLTFDEIGTHEQQFNLLQNIKRAKIIFALPEEKFKLIKNKVRINAERDVRLEVAVTKEEFLDYVNKGVGIDGKRVIAVSARIAEYICAELKRPNNSDVTQVIMSGGASETVGLKEVIVAALKKNFADRIQLLPFVGEGDFETQGKFRVGQTEKHIYSASAGAAILATNKYIFKTFSSLSYGTWYLTASGAKTLKILIRKGMEIPQKLNRYGSIFQANTNTSFIDKEEFFSTPEVLEFAIGDPGTIARRTAESAHGLRVISGGNARICFGKKLQNGDMTLVKAPKTFRFEEGIEIDQDGRAKPYIINADTRAECKDILAFFDGLNDFAIKSIVKEDK